MGRLFLVNELMYALTLEKRKNSPFGREIGSLHAALLFVFPIASLSRLAFQAFDVPLGMLATTIYRRIAAIDLIAGAAAFVLVWVVLDRRRSRILARFGWATRNRAMLLFIEAWHICLFIAYAFLYVRSPMLCLCAFALVAIVGQAVFGNGERAI